ncbi:MAG: isochorismate synthase [Aquiluna sp.]|nr:isochorismate synthase [Aquiluna sp.]
MALSATIRRIDAPADLNLKDSSVFLRAGQQIIASGKAVELSATGPTRISDLAKAWKELISTAEIADDTGLSGTGIIALTSITFSASSKAKSVVYVPRVTRVYRDGIGFEVVVQSEPEATEVTAIPTGRFTDGPQSKAKFVEGIEKALKEISATDLEKVVIGRDLVLPLDARPDLAIPLARLHQKYPQCWTYMIGDVFGASPELLLRSTNGEVSARVLAGTAGRGTDPDVDRAISEGLMLSQKNRHEHDYAVSSMVSQLEPFCEWVEADAEPFSLALPDLWHLATDVRGKLKDSESLLDVITKLHPTAAVAGTPRGLAKDLILELEPFDRAGYAGPVGWLSSDGGGELAIALRGGVIEQHQIRAIAGCGIVAESDPAAELAETELKFKAVRYAFDQSL